MQEPWRRTRRPGFSRRAQYGLFFGYVIAIGGALIGLALIAVARIDPPAFEAVRGIALDLTAPVSEAGRALVRGGGGAIGVIWDYVDAGSQNAGLRAELAASRRALVQARIDALQNRALRATLHLIEIGDRPIAVARLTGSTATSTRRSATLSAGSAQGVRPGQPVRSADGLVGRVAETGAFAARVTLVTDPGSVVPVRILRTGAAALAVGRGDGAIELRPITAGANPFRRGDVVATSGAGGVYPPDLPVAVVASVSGDVAVAWPLADPARLDFAIVEPLAPAPPPARVAPDAAPRR